MPELSRPAERIIYLHGFASGPGAHKARLFARALADRGLPVEIPDLNLPSFADLTVGRQLALLERLCQGATARSIVLIGSSLGGYAAALQAARSEAIAAQVLMAPAFDIHRRWAQRLGPGALGEWRRRGFMLVFHHGYGRLEAIRFSLHEEGARHPAFPPIRVPTLIFHGRADEVVDPAGSVQQAAAHPDQVELVLLDDDHGLATSAPRIVEHSLRFLSPWLPPPSR